MADDGDGARRLGNTTATALVDHGDAAAHKDDGATVSCAVNMTATCVSIYEDLEALYDALGGASWHQSTHWNDRSVTYCQWFGIGCYDDSSASATVGEWLSQSPLVKQIIHG